MARKKTLDKVLFDVLDVEDSSQLVLSLNLVGCNSIDDLLALTQTDIEQLCYRNGDVRVSVSPVQRNLIKALKAWNYYLLLTRVTHVATGDMDEVLP